MSHFIKSRKRGVAALSLVALLAVGGGLAYAYLTTTGSGTGSGDVTATTSPLALTFSQPAFTALGQSQTVSIYATNTASSAEQFTGLASFSATPSSGSCPAGSFVAGTPSTSTTSIPADGNPHLVGTVSVTFTNLPAAAQNSCLGAGAVSYSATSN